MMIMNSTLILNRKGKNYMIIRNIEEKSRVMLLNNLIHESLNIENLSGPLRRKIGLPQARLYKIFSFFFTSPSRKNDGKIKLNL